MNESDLELVRNRRAVSLIDSLNQLGVRAAHVSLAPAKSAGVNVWHRPEDRYPLTTVAIDDREVAWGHKWEHTRAADLPADDLARAIQSTLDTIAQEK